MKKFNEFVNESNMSYCRFENTYRDLLDCYNNFDDDLSGTEFRYRKDLLKLCQRIIDSYDDGEFVDVEEHENEIAEDEERDYRTKNIVPNSDIYGGLGTKETQQD